MIDPLAPTSGILPRLVLATALTTVIWVVVAWALLA
jgi:hypothetical protein